MKFNKEKLKNTYRIIMAMIISALVTFSVTSILLYKTGKIQYIAVTKSDTTGLGTLLSSFKTLLDQKYLYDMDEEQMSEAAIKAYIEAIGDEYTVYYTPEEMKEFKIYTVGNYVGIGIYIYGDTENNNIIVVPIKGGPAEQVGIQSGDIVKKVDNKSYNANKTSELSNYIKNGEEGTTVEIEILRNDEILNYTVERKKIEIYPVEGTILEDNIGYIPLYNFDEGCAEKFKDEYNKLKDKEITSLIIDLRDNGGGIVNEATDIANYILDKDSEIIITVDKNGKEEITTSKDNPIINIPIVILVNENDWSVTR